MVYNKYNFKNGDIVVLDKGYRNSSLVKIIELSKPSGMFCKVHPAKLDDAKDEDCWDVMTNRLTPKI